MTWYGKATNPSRDKKLLESPNGLERGENIVVVSMLDKNNLMLDAGWILGLFEVQ